VSLYSTQFFAGTIPTNALTNAFTVPAGELVVLRDMDALIVTASDLFNVQIGVAGATTVVWYVTATATPEWVQWQGRTVVKAGESIWVYSSGSNTQAVLSGYLLTQ